LPTNAGEFESRHKWLSLSTIRNSKVFLSFVGRRNLNINFPCFNLLDSNYEGTVGTVTGWGTLKEDGKPSCLLQEVDVPVMSNADCIKNTNYTAAMISWVLGVSRNYFMLNLILILGTIWCVLAIQESAWKTLAREIVSFFVFLIFVPNYIFLRQQLVDPWLRKEKINGTS
jgi:hypothetical protein